MRRRAGTYLAAVVFAVPFLLPFYLLLRNAFMTQAELGALDWSWWPSSPSLQGFRDAFANESVPLGRALVNSTIVAVVSRRWPRCSPRCAGTRSRASGSR